MPRRSTLDITGHGGTSRYVAGPESEGPRGSVVARQAQRGLLALVCSGLAVYGAVTAWLMPLSARIHYDPSLQYMLASLAWFRGGTYAYIDHPGTPVEVLGTLLLALSYPLAAATPEGFIAYHLIHPQEFLSVVQTLMVFASIGVCVLLAARSVVVVHWSQALLGSAVAASFFTLLPGAFESLALWSHESFCFPAGTLLSLAVLVTVRRTGCPSWRVSLGLGFATGVLTSVQLYFAAWVVGTAVALSIAMRLTGASWRTTGGRASCIVATAGLGFIVATLPIRDHYRGLAGWLLLLISHQGTYGSGPAGLPGPDLLAANLSGLVFAAPLAFAAGGAAALIVVWRLWLSRARPASHPVQWAAGLGCLTQLLVLIVLVAKHPGVRYLLPVAATIPILFAVALEGLDARRRMVRALLVGFGLAVLAGFASSLTSALASHASMADELKRNDMLTETTLSTLATRQGSARSSLRTLWTYGTSSPCYALWFGDDSADRIFDDDIARLCPNDLNLNPWNASVTTTSGDKKLVDYSDWDVAVLPADIARLLPQLTPPGTAYPSSIPSLSFGQLVFVVPAA